MSGGVFEWYNITLDSLEGLWQGFLLGFLPQFVGAVIVFVIGLAISVGVGRLATDILKRIKFNLIFERGNWDEALARADFKIDPSVFIGTIVKWVLVVVFLSASLEILGLDAFTRLLNDRVLTYLPNIVVGAFVFVVAVILADIVEKVLRVTVEGAQVGYGRAIGLIVKWSIWILAIVIILDQLSIAGALPQTLFTGLVAMIALAGGLAFGLGGKEMAADVLKDLKDRMRK